MESLKVTLINMVTILSISAKLVTLGLLKIKAIQNESYDVIIFVHDIAKKTLPHAPNCIIYAAMWLKINDYSISMKEVNIASIL